MVPQIIQIVEGVPTVSHRVVAENIGVQAKNVAELIQTHKAYFERFGNLTFQTEGLERQNAKGQNRGTVDQKTYYLNEMQATFLITLSKNTGKVVAFKAALVRAFDELRSSKPQSPSKYESILHDHIIELNTRIEKLESRPMLLPNPRVSGAPFSDEEKENIRSLRRDYNCSTVEIARRMGCSERSVRRVLKSESAPKHQGIFERMAQSLFGDAA
ncbi:MAG: Rha family transcriptional regulator [Campylobacterales bacterium]|nr:Rha family transcriptional regulator [Campylobacterales bacterium]